MHQRINALYDSAPLTESETTRLTQLESDEVDMYAQRRELHEQIDVLRAKVGLRPKREEIAAAAALIG